MPRRDPESNRIGCVAAVFGGALAACVAVLLLVNISWFDEPLDPGLEALRAQVPISFEDNGYPAALRFLEADDPDPHATETRDAWRRTFTSLECNPRRYLDCAERLVVEVAGSDSLQPRVALLLGRYEALLRHAHFTEVKGRDAYTQTPSYGAIRDVGRLRLAISYRSETTSELLTKAAQDLGFWKTVLRETEALSTKMTALAGIQGTLDFLSTLMRERDLRETEIEYLEQFVTPFSSEESDIGEAFLAEARTAVLSDKPPVAPNASWPMRLLLQRNATLNQFYREVILPMQRRAALGAREFYEQGGHEALKRELHMVPQTLYNLSGKLALSRSGWDPHEYPTRVHDQNGRISLVLLQAELERTQGTAVAAVVRKSKHLNLYTGEAMEYDAGTHVISFKCLHSAFHPPDTPDVCAVAVERARS